MARYPKKKQNKKNIFFVSPIAMVMFLSACTGSVYHADKTDGTATGRPHPSRPLPINTQTSRGIHLTISNQSSLTIDVECIADYVQKALSVIGNAPTANHDNPWVSWDWHF